jgi:hypothetical protein
MEITLSFSCKSPVDVVKFLEIAPRFSIPQPDWMSFNRLDGEVDYDPVAIVERFNRKIASVSFGDSKNEISYFQVWNDPKEGSGGIVSLDSLAYKSDAQMLEMLEALLESGHRVVRASVDIGDYYREEFRKQIPVSNRALGPLGWLHLTSPEKYAPFFTRDDLLNAPAHEVLEWDDGTIQIMTYKDFLPYDRPEALKAIRGLSLYLNEKRLDGPRMVPELATYIDKPV